MKLLYSLSIRFYAFAIRVVSLWNPKAKQWINGRKEWLNNLKKSLSDKKNIHWFHCASLGEFEQARPLIEKIKSEKPDTPILVTFFSPSGYEQRKNYNLAEYVCYLPLDTKSNAKEFISSIDISKAYFVKYEVWPNYFIELSNQSILFYLISATFREEQIYFKSIGKWFKKLLKLPTLIFVQDKASEEILNRHNINCLVSGDTRFDRVSATAKKAVPNRIMDDFCRGKFTLIAGSSWEKEEEIISNAFYSLNQSFRVVFAPHDISEPHVKGIIQRLKKDTRYIKYSEVKEGINVQDYEVLILDNIGLLSNTYQYGSVAFVGGGFTNALHNILEPATFGLPVFYGDNHPKYPEGKKMKEEGAGLPVGLQNEFEIKLKKIIEDEEYLKELSTKSKMFIQTQTGATEEIYEATIKS